MNEPEPDPSFTGSEPAPPVRHRSPPASGTRSRSWRPRSPRRRRPGAPPSSVRHWRCEPSSSGEPSPSCGASSTSAARRRAAPRSRARGSSPTRSPGSGKKGPPSVRMAAGGICEPGLLARLLGGAVPQRVQPQLARLEHAGHDLLHQQVLGLGQGGGAARGGRRRPGRSWWRVRTSTPRAVRAQITSATASSVGRSMTSILYSGEAVPSARRFRARSRLRRRKPSSSRARAL